MLGNLRLNSKLQSLRSYLTVSYCAKRYQLLQIKHLNTSKLLLSHGTRVFTNFFFRLFYYCSESLNLLYMLLIMSSGNTAKVNRELSFDFIYLPWYQFIYVFSTFLFPWYYSSNPVKRLRLTTYLHRTNNSNFILKCTWNSYCGLFWLCLSVLVDFYAV